MKLPVDIRDLMNSGTKLREDREKAIRIAVFALALLGALVSR